MELQPAVSAGSPGSGSGSGPQLRHRAATDPSSANGSPLLGQLDTFSRQQSAMERGGALPGGQPAQVTDVDAAEPAAPPTGSQRACAWLKWGGRRVLRVLPLVPIYAATITTVALIFALKNFNILDQARAASLVRLLRGEVGEAHMQILNSLQTFQAELNSTLAALCQGADREG